VAVVVVVAVTLVATEEVVEEVVAAVGEDSVVEWTEEEVVVVEWIEEAREEVNLDLLWDPLSSLRAGPIYLYTNVHSFNLTMRQALDDLSVYRNVRADI
jgi:hypothetical protein